MARESPRSISINANLRCLRIYPTPETAKSVKDLKTVGFKLSKTQAIDLARVLLAVTQDWEELEITGYRSERRQSDGTYHVTVTTSRR